MYQNLTKFIKYPPLIIENNSTIKNCLDIQEKKYSIEINNIETFRYQKIVYLRKYFSLNNLDHRTRL